ncbi:hypothetical protein SmJEL517_g04860 [Synchytrium microbalum]|uniref:Aminoglycoside phosphotransferase domain-containing protein n=1 Tax=Synchytrium microbalum TaxID=1806994 RepID=A0A507BXV9_9FUNG|nr:uncharacterized protein SmJEL517_g04860 [Synchytrium microbalum]TPX31941.1 hypothetical protein SmJEL517_g04860 [Synchytrium microbalum]
MAAAPSKTSLLKVDDPEALGAHLALKIPGFQPPLTLKQFKTGQSNPTYMLEDSRGVKYVLRKKPPGKLVPRAHQIEREFEIMSALKQGSTLPIPKPYYMCEDPSIIGSAFYVMEFVEGRVIENGLFPDVPDQDRHAYWYELIDVLAAFHSVNYKAVGLANFSHGRVSNYFERQVKVYSEMGASQAPLLKPDGTRLGELNRQAELEAWLRKQAKALADESTLVHGDYKAGNIMFHPTQPKIVAILDWETSTVGHPLNDLATILMSFYLPNGYRNLPRPLSIPEPEALIRRYCAAAKRPYPIKGLDFCIAFTLYRAGIQVQGIAARVLKGQNNNADGRVQDFLQYGDVALEIMDGRLKINLGKL